jgi:aspartyl/asparaginyl beta-hydroxylase (cupin superfamily)
MSSVPDDHKCTEKNPRFFYDPADFPFLAPVSEHFGEMREELLDLLHLNKEDQWLRTFPSYVRADKARAWKVFSFVFFSMKIPSNAALCPRTAKLIYSIPEIISCDFSYLSPRTNILPHKGYSKMILRCHLPLIVPKGDCALRVGNETRQWKEGELMIFDDSFEHEAWNNSNEERIVLMFDIPNPRWEYSAHEISKYKIEHIDDPFLLSLADRAQWLEAFKKGIVPLSDFSGK